MGDRKVGAILNVLLVLAIIPFAVNDAFADGYNNSITAEDLGILQLAAHDLFNVDRCDREHAECAIDFEDGKLNLSTIFEDTVNGGNFNETTVAMGGEPRNRENIMLFTVASDLGSLYVKLLDDGVDITAAKQTVIDMYHKKLAKTYQKTFHESFPSSMGGNSTSEENLALRTIHDFLPGKIKINNKMISTLHPDLNGLKLDKKELKQKSSKLDGQFDDEFLHIEICFPPDFGTCIDVNLLEADQSFGDQFGTAYSFDELLDELEDGRYDKDDKALYHIRNLMAKGQNF